MTYYNDDKLWFKVDGVNTLWTELAAEILEMDGHLVVPEWDMDSPLPVAAAEDYLEHTCGDELPDGRTLGTCLLCQLSNEDIPFE